MADKTWSIVADKMGGHWHITVRRGIEGSRARLGEMAFDLSDVDDFRQALTVACDRVVTRTVLRTIEKLGQRGRFGMYVAGSTLAEDAVDIGEQLRAECDDLFLDHLVLRFGVRVDLAKVNG